MSWFRKVPDIDDIELRLSRLEQQFGDCGGGGHQRLRPKYLDVPKLSDLTSDLGSVTQGSGYFGSTYGRGLGIGDAEDGIDSFDEHHRIYWRAGFAYEFWRLGLPGTPTIEYLNDAVVVDGRTNKANSIPGTSLNAPSYIQSFITTGRLDSGDGVDFNVPMRYVRFGDEFYGSKVTMATEGIDIWNLVGTADVDAIGVKFHSQYPEGSPIDEELVKVYLEQGYKLRIWLAEGVDDWPSLELGRPNAVKAYLAHDEVRTTTLNDTAYQTIGAYDVFEDGTDVYSKWTLYDGATQVEMSSAKLDAYAVYLSGPRVEIVNNVIHFSDEARPGTPQEGDMRWDFTNHRPEWYNGSAWRYPTDNAA